MAKIAVISLGCPKNRVDSDNLLDALGKEGFYLTAAPEDADLIIVNTCGFIEEAKRESIEEILRIKEMKKEGKKLLVFGCLAQRYRDDLLREIPEIDALWGVAEDAGIIEYCRKEMNPGRGEDEAWRQREMENVEDRRVESYAYLKIADGCDRGCSFCVIPAIRGPFRSGNADSILKKAEEHIASGAKELILVAQDIGNYGREFGGYTLASLLTDLASLSGDFWIRLLYLYPTAITDELLSVIAGEDKICKYLDIPLQHSEDRMLRAMGRGGTKKWYGREIEKIREMIPDITLRTTFIVGFPGEREEDFEGLKEFIEEMKFERLGVFTYSREEGTPAAQMKDNLSRKLKEKRREEIMRLQSYISLEKNRALVGKRLRALVDEVDGNVAVARLSCQTPEIDGVVIIEKEERAQRMGHGVREKMKFKNSPLLIHRSSLSLKPGDFVTVEILEAYDYDLKGVVIDDFSFESDDSESEIKKHKLCNLK